MITLIFFYVVHSKFHLVSDQIKDKIIDKITMLFFLAAIILEILLFHSDHGRKCGTGVGF